MLLEELAKELVDITASLVGGRTVNIMNTEGVIVASSDKSRVGTFHAGALKAVQTGRPVTIRPDQLDQYPGAKEGCNMPLRVNGALFGVVGLYGDPAEIQSLARLLEVYAAKYIQLEAMASPRLAAAELRVRLLRFLLAPSEDSMARAQRLMDTLNLRPQPPYTVLVLRLKTPLQEGGQAQLLELLGRQGLLQAGQDIYGMLDERLIIVRCGTPPPRRLDAALLEQCRVSVSDSCGSLWEVPARYEQACRLDERCAGPLNDLRELPVRCGYMLCTVSADNAPFLEALYARLAAAFRAGELDAVLRTAGCYYDCERSVAKAAGQLFIHKNTLQYRVRRLLEAMGAEHCSGFEQELLVRLLLEYHRSGRRGTSPTPQPPAPQKEGGPGA